jgi:hypothetical protein
MGRYDERRLRLNVGSEGEEPISGLRFNCNRHWLQGLEVARI